MNRHWPLFIAIVAGVTPVAAQLTPQQRLEREWKAVQNTIGRTRELEAERRDDWDPLRGMRCGEGAARRAYGCTAANWKDERVRRDAPTTPAVSATHWVGFASAPLRREELHPLGVGPVEFQAMTATTMTLSSTIGGAHRALIIRTAVGPPDEQPTWSRMGEVEGDPQGRYLITIPALAPGTYQLDIQVYDPDRPVVPASASANRLIVR